MSDVSKQNNCNGGPEQVANNQNSKEHQSGQSNSQSNVRYIPITLDYDDKTVNTDNNKTTEQQSTANSNSTNATKPTSGRYQHSNHFTNDPPKPTSIFDRVKHFPVNLRSTQQQRNESPGRTIPINVQSDGGRSPPSATSPKPTTTQPPFHSHQYDEVDSAPRSSSDDKLNADASAIQKIQIIQKEIQGLMDQVDSFGGTRKDKDYMYLDEMLTQNLLKLDTIDTDGKEKIKQARREAIKCIHTCISVLEAKAEAGNTQPQQSNDKSQAKSHN